MHSLVLSYRHLSHCVYLRGYAAHTASVIHHTLQFTHSLIVTLKDNPNKSLVTVSAFVCGLQRIGGVRIEQGFSDKRDNLNWEALTATSLAYRYKIPLLTFSAFFPEASHSFRRSILTSSLTSQSIVRVSASTMILSPSFTRAMGPPRRASGTTWPIRRQKYTSQTRS